jgi:hypothetical protein
MKNEGQGDGIGIMTEKEEMRVQAEQEKNELSPADTASQPETSTRRELIERYAKCAIAAAPLFLFVSKARAIHSRP